jgi:hypothetical protein
MLKVIGPKRVVIHEPGVVVSAAYDGGHQAYAHVREGVYWEACYVPTNPERIVQRMLLDPSYSKPQHHWLVTNPERARARKDM